MKKLFFMFVMVFAISVTATANETTKLNEVEVENVIHTDFSEALSITTTRATMGSCFDYYFSGELSFWSSFMDAGSSIALAVISTNQKCNAIFREMADPDWNGINLFIDQAPPPRN